MLTKIVIGIIIAVVIVYALCKNSQSVPASPAKKAVDNLPKASAPAVVPVKKTPYVAPKVAKKKVTKAVTKKKTK